VVSRKIGNWCARNVSHGWITRITPGANEAPGKIRQGYRGSSPLEKRSTNCPSRASVHSLRSWLLIQTKISSIPCGCDAKAMTKSAPKSVRALETNRSGDGIDREVLGRQAAPGL